MKTYSDKIFDAWLVLQSQSGNKKPMSLLVKRWHKKLCRHAYFYTHDLDRAKDVVQDSWAMILAKVNGLQDPNSFGSWAFSIVTRKAIDSHRKRKSERTKLERYYDSTDNSGDDGHHDLTLHRMALIKKHLDGLPEGQRVVLNFFYLDEYSIREIGAILNLSEGTVKSRLFNAREKLKTILKQSDYEK